ncbi:hypothetical protein [Sporosarcina sp. ZBG7A]|uniref:hypothetical protein n=1 Tax=Sporosarcina sp. ZBG7A TaxID=1582223 RepID=UPI00057A408C|nr:hypothetical protein [Sporosarcina sp. ZBG7A]
MLDEIIGYVVVVFLITGFTYGFVRQIQDTLTIRKANKTAVSNYRRTLIGNYITCLSFGGVLISYLLNVLVAMRIIQSNILTSNNTGFSCFVFLVVLLIAKFGAIPKSRKQMTF